MASVELSVAESVKKCRYQIREKFFAIGNHFKIKDELGHNRYIVRSKSWILGVNLLFEDMNGNVLLKIRRKGFRLLDQFSILAVRENTRDQPVASIRQKLTFLKHSYKIYSIYGEYKLKGLNMLDHTFSLKTKDDRTIATVNKKLFSVADTYEVEVMVPSNDRIKEDHVLILSLVIALHCSLYCA